MTNPDFIHGLIDPYGPTAPLEALVVELNKLYHSFEAEDYDRRHPEVHVQLPPLWAEMIQLVRSHSAERCWNVLDFGCGTGFEALQILAGLEAAHIQSLTCYDPSREMLALCKSKIAPRCAQVRFCSTLAEVWDTRDGYDLLLTNSLLHHLPSPSSEILSLERTLKKHAWWLMGHEPSKRFYTNPECYAELRQYREQLAWRNLVSPEVYWNRLQILLGLKINPAQATAAAAHKAGLFARRPAPAAVSRLVDFNVPHSSAEASAGRGFDIRELECEFASHWSLRWVRTYAFMASSCTEHLPAQWRERCHQLAAKYPLDGANFCSAWSHA